MKYQWIYIVYPGVLKKNKKHVHNLVNLVRTHILYMCMHVCLYIVYISCIILCRYTFWACAATMRFPQLLGLELLCSSDLLLRTLQYRPHQLLLPGHGCDGKLGHLQRLAVEFQVPLHLLKETKAGKPHGKPGGFLSGSVFTSCSPVTCFGLYNINAIYTPLHSLHYHDI